MAMESKMAHFALHVNGEVRSIEADGSMPLLWALRALLELTGTKYISTNSGNPGMRKFSFRAIRSDHVGFSIDAPNRSVMMPTIVSSGEQVRRSRSVPKSGQ